MKEKAGRKQKVLCPLISYPYPDCYIANMGSINVENAVYYCAGHYDRCRIYEKYIGQEETGAGMPASDSRTG